MSKKVELIFTQIRKQLFETCVKLVEAEGPIGVDPRTLRLGSISITVGYLEDGHPHNNGEWNVHRTVTVQSAGRVVFDAVIVQRYKYSKERGPPREEVRAFVRGVWERTIMKARRDMR